MGDVAEMMLDGTLCQSCGAFAGGPVGYPRDCHSCRSTLTPIVANSKTACGICGKKVKKGQGEKDHMRMMHPPED